MKSSYKVFRCISDYCDVLHNNNNAVPEFGLTARNLFTKTLSLYPSGYSHYYLRAILDVVSIETDTTCSRYLSMFRLQHAWLTRFPANFPSTRLLVHGHSDKLLLAGPQPMSSQRDVTLAPSS